MKGGEVFTPKRVVVCGAAGFIGSRLVEILVENFPETEIVALDALTYAGRKENLESALKCKRVSFVRANICDPDIEIHFDGADAIVSLAASTHVDRSIQSSQEFMQTNVMGVHNLLEIVRGQNIRQYVQVSSDESYGPSYVDTTPQSLGGFYRFKETDKVNPSSPYAASKTAGELLCLAYYKTYRTRVTITRGSNTYGPRQHPEKFIPLFISNMLWGCKCPLYGDGSQLRSWMYVDDHCRGILAALQRGVPGEIYNLGPRNRDTLAANINIALKVAEYLDVSSDLIATTTDRPGHDAIYAINSQKACISLGWEPSVSFDAGLKHTVEWYKKNKRWWETIRLEKDFVEYYDKQYGSV